MKMKYFQIVIKTEFMKFGNRITDVHNVQVKILNLNIFMMENANTIQILIKEMIKNFANKMKEMQKHVMKCIRLLVDIMFRVGNSNLLVIDALHVQILIFNILFLLSVIRFKVVTIFQVMHIVVLQILIIIIVMMVFLRRGFVWFIVVIK